MKITCLLLCFLGLAALVSADDAGFFVPKAFYNLDAEGHKSNVHEINPHQANILRRLRRQATSSSSSSYISTSDGGPAFFKQHQEVKVSPGLQSRFSDDDDNIPSGYAVHTEGVIHPNGQIYQDTRREKLY